MLVVGHTKPGSPLHQALRCLMHGGIGVQTALDAAPVLFAPDLFSPNLSSHTDRTPAHSAFALYGPTVVLPTALQQ